MVLRLECLADKLGFSDEMTSDRPLSVRDVKVIYVNALVSFPTSPRSTGSALMTRRLFNMLVNFGEVKRINLTYVLVLPIPPFHP